MVRFAMVMRKVQNQGGGCDVHESPREPATDRDSAEYTAGRTSTHLPSVMVTFNREAVTDESPLQSLIGTPSSGTKSTWRRIPRTTSRLTCTFTNAILP
jgi:hypothetical protein